MTAVRHLLAQRAFAMLICAAALCLKLLVPAGYMIASEHGHIAITLCPGVAAEPMTMDMSAMHGTMPDHGGKDHGKAEMPCAFSGLSALALGAVDPILLAVFIAFILATGLRPATRPALLRRAHLRPPLRGPPALL